jgi:hypothetical protein
MDRRPVAVFAAGLWILIAGFAQLRPLVHTARPVLPPLWIDVVVSVLGLLVIAVVIGLLRMRRRFAFASIAICLAWTLILAIRIALALLYSPDIFGSTLHGNRVYVAPLVAMALNAITIAYLLSRRFRFQ